VVFLRKTEKLAQNVHVGENGNFLGETTIVGYIPRFQAKQKNSWKMSHREQRNSWAAGARARASARGANEVISVRPNKGTADRGRC